MTSLGHKKAIEAVALKYGAKTSGFMKALKGLTPPALNLACLGGSPVVPDAFTIVRKTVTVFEVVKTSHISSGKLWKYMKLWEYLDCEEIDLHVLVVDLAGNVTAVDLGMVFFDSIDANIKGEPFNGDVHDYLVDIR